MRLVFIEPWDMLSLAKVMPASNSLMTAEIVSKEGLDTQLVDRVIRSTNLVVWHPEANNYDLDLP